MKKVEVIYIGTVLFLAISTTLVFAVNFDFNNDGIVNITDIDNLAAHFHGKAAYNSTFDFNNDSVVNVFDIVAVAKNEGSNSYPNEPAGLTDIFRFDPADGNVTNGGVLEGLGQASSSNFSRYESIINASTNPTLPVSMPTGAALKHIMANGTVDGYAEPPGEYAEYYFWDSDGIVNDGHGQGNLHAREYSKMYMSMYFSIYGNGTDVELSASETNKFPGYFAVTNNNQGSPTQMGMTIRAVNSTNHSSSGAPLTASEFWINVFMQNGFTWNVNQNLNLSKHVVVGQVHHLELLMDVGTVNGGDGTADWWLDNVHVGHYTNISFLNTSFAQGNGTGTAGFWGMQFSPWFGGQGPWNKTRDDWYLVGPTKISGLYLREAT